MFDRLLAGVKRGGQDRGGELSSPQALSKSYRCDAGTLYKSLRKLGRWIRDEDSRRKNKGPRHSVTGPLTLVPSF